MYKYYNCNPAHRQVNDCVVRAISLAQNKSWDKVYSELSTLAQQSCVLLDDVSFVEPYLNERYNKTCYKINGHRISVNDFIKQNPLGTYLVTMKGHITCIIDGTIYDTWNCEDNIIWCAWEVI